MRNVTISVVVVVLVVVSIYRVAMDSSDNGIVKVPGYEHGVALCEGEEDFSKGLYGEAYMWAEDGILYVINEGHENDPEVQALEDLARSRCVKLFSTFGI